MNRPRLHLNKANALRGVFILAALASVAHFIRSSDAGAPDAAAMPATPVVVQTLAEQKVRVWSEFSGRLKAVDAAEVRPEVSGRITEIRFEDGQTVKAGDVLFVIDPRPYEAAVARAEAALATAKSNAEFAKLDRQRAAGMVKTQAIPQRLYDERSNTSRVTEATVQSAEADVKQARLNLEYAYVKAPISGRASRAEITVGNLVQSGSNAPLLTTVVASEAIYADFEVDEQTYLQSIRSNAAGREDERKIPVQLLLKSAKAEPIAGTIHSFDNQLNVHSGTIRARAKFENADGALVPGMFVTVKLASAGDDSELLIPEQALGFDQNKKFVYVVDADNKVSYREVELGKQVNAQRVALNGVQAGERVIVEGLQHVRPDAVVAPTELSAVQPAAGTDGQANR